MAHKYLKPKHHYQTCPQCGNHKLQHMLCGHCFRETMKKTAEFRKERAAEGRRRREGTEEAVSVETGGKEDEQIAESSS